MQDKRLIVIIPALNEQQTIADVINRIPRKMDGAEVVKVVVVDDGSTDATADAALKAGADVVSHANNRGVGIAFATGVKAALARGADIVVNMDGDGQFSPEDIPALVRPILKDGAEFVTCSRFGNPEVVPVMPRTKLVGNHMMSWLISRLCRGQRHFTDVSCGFRAYTRETLLRMNLFGQYTYTQETFINLASMGVEMAEVPLRIRGTREFGKSRVAGSLLKYVSKTVPIIFRTFRDLHPLGFFGIIASVVILAGLVMGAFVFIHWLQTGYTTPYRSMLIGSAVGLILGFVFLVLALLADMLNRIRMLLEELLFINRTALYRDQRPQPKVSERDVG
ncbi:MAG: glycosyltransferase family 2 protein [Planctomycetaceae bacterium]|nr:glycosyltransferase family 2 protein [Planctomycetaceae bacterium]